VDAATGDSVVTKTLVKAFTDGNTYKEVTKVTYAKDRTAKPKELKTKTTWLSSGNFWMLVLLVLIQIIYVTMVYGPIAAYLVELFPTRIRYTSMSLPYHIGNGIFGGLTPLIATRLFDVSKTTDNPAGDPLVGLWYPIIIAAVCFVIGFFYMPNRTAENTSE
jgi:MHS family proline/betaine transporter-like MFS transporter